MPSHDPLSPPSAVAPVTPPGADRKDSPAAPDKKPPAFTADADALAAIVGGYHGAPFDILGMHPVTVAGKPGLVVRTFQPQALEVSVNRNGKLYPMTRVHPDGFCELVFPGETTFFSYRLLIVLPDQSGYETEDPYRFSPVLTDFDLHLFNEGNHYRLYDKLGAHLITQ